jgi:hypothetical protein
VGKGYEFDNLIARILGRRFRKPLKKWSGGQILEIYWNIDLLWGSDPLVHGITNLQADSKVANIIRALKAVLNAPSEIHGQLSTPEPELEVLSDDEKLQWKLSKKRLALVSFTVPLRRAGIASMTMPQWHMFVAWLLS